jgi:pimeloyl-ACP methyl ester carboxylesterase
MKHYKTVTASKIVLLLCAALSISACYGGTQQRGVLASAPNKVQTLSPTQFDALLAEKDPALLAVAGHPSCTVTLYSFSYSTIGGKGEPAEAGAALMLPSGDEPKCHDARPLVLYAHGTSADKNYDMANLNGDINGQNGGLLAAAFYAAQGYIVVAPNYVGYSGSSLNYHPYLNAEQQSSDMMDSLRAARRSFDELQVPKPTALFLTGYSQGAYVAMATLHAMQDNANEFQVTSLATGSGPYALSYTLDRSILGTPTTLAPLLFNLIGTSWARSYGNIQAQQTYAATYADHMDGLLPGTVPQEELFAKNILPLRAMYETGTLPGPNTQDPNTALVAKAGFAPTNFLINSDFRQQLVRDIEVNACQPGEECNSKIGLRLDAWRNDLRHFSSRVPVQLCGAHSDSLVFYNNTLLMAEHFKKSGTPARDVTVVDMDPGDAEPAEPYLSLKKGFLKTLAKLKAEAGPGEAGALKVADNIHIITAPYCIAVDRAFFETAVR